MREHECRGFRRRRRGCRPRWLQDKFPWSGRINFGQTRRIGANHDSRPTSPEPRPARRPGPQPSRQLWPSGEREKRHVSFQRSPNWQYDRITHHVCPVPKKEKRTISLLNWPSHEEWSDSRSSESKSHYPPNLGESALKLFWVSMLNTHDLHRISIGDW